MTHYHKERAAELNKKERSILNPQGWEGIDKIRSDIAEYYKKCNWNMPSTRCTRNMSQLEESKMHYEKGLNSNGITDATKFVQGKLDKDFEVIGPFKVAWPTEERIDNIGQNGPTGEHYMNKYQRKLTNPIIKEMDGGLTDIELEVIIDVYDVLDAFDVSNPATAHAIKKLLCTGSRGAKDWETDLQEAIDSLERAKSFPPLPF
jgi:hypothetical protein